MLTGKRRSQPHHHESQAEAAEADVGDGRIQGRAGVDGDLRRRDEAAGAVGADGGVGCLVRWVHR